MFVGYSKEVAKRTEHVSGTLEGARDMPGRTHTAIRSETGIDGVQVFVYPRVDYVHGSLIEVLHPEWDKLFGEPIAHCYFISNHKRLSNEWHHHERTVDRYSVISGKIHVALFDPRASSPTHGKLLLIELVGITTDDSGSHGIRIPEGVWHSIRSFDPFTLMNFKTKPFNRSEPDKFRIQMPNKKSDFTWLK